MTDELAFPLAFIGANTMIEQLKEIPVQPAKEVPCDIKYLTVYLWTDRDGHPVWLSDQHRTLVGGNEWQ